MLDKPLHRADVDKLFDCWSAAVSSFNIRPIRLTSLITPHPTNKALVLTADAKISGVESGEIAGVRAAVIGA